MAARSTDCNLGWGRGGGGLPDLYNNAGLDKGDESDEQRAKVEFYGRVHFKIIWLAKMIVNHAAFLRPIASAACEYA